MQPSHNNAPGVKSKGAKSFKQTLEEAAANDDDPSLDFEREEAFHKWFYDELAKCDRGEEAQVRRWVAEPRFPATKISFFQFCDELKKWERRKQDAASPIKMRVPTSLRPAGKGSIDVFELLLPQWVPPAAKTNKSDRDGQEANGPSAGDTASVPFMITAAQKQQLADLGYSEADIFEMKPEEAQRILAGALPKQEKPKQENVPLEFLRALRPQGPWVLTAIDPDTQAIETSTAHSAEADAFVGKYNGNRNLYYSVNPTHRAMSKKAAKTDIAIIEYALADLDPNKGETSDAAKARYLEQLNDVFEPKPVAAIDSGNGIQCLWRLQDCIALGDPVNGKFSSEDQDKIDDVEARIEAVMLRLGSKAGTQNIDRILRLPGTTNLPNEKKRKDGRVPCPTKLLWFNGASYPLSAFPKPEEKAEKASEKSERKAGATFDELNDIIYNGCGDRFEGDRSRAVWFVINEMLRRGYAFETIVGLLLDRDNAISEHVYDQKKPEKYAERQVTTAISKLDFIRDEDGKIFANQTNIRIALVKLGVTLRYDEFSARTSLDGLPGFGSALEDAAVDRIWLKIDQVFHFRPTLELTQIVLSDTARLNGFHPVKDYLDTVQEQWDGVERIDTWLTTYGGAVNDKYTRAVGRLMLVAAVRRIRQPGCKFDEMVVLEQEQQGTNKSTALAVLAVREEWFTDDLPLNADSKRMIEHLRGKWIVEAAELSGMRKADSEHLKAFLSRQEDRARMAYGRLVVELKRQCIVVGTTNKAEYLPDTTGNRRFWPILVEGFDLGALKRDRDQLWAEAATCEATGESIRLPRELWPMAAKEQKQRLADDPFVAVLDKALGDLEGKIRAADVWVILDIRGGQLNQHMYARAAEAMRRIGFVRPNKAGTARFSGSGTNKLQAAYIRGPLDDAKEIHVERGQYGMDVFFFEDGQRTRIDED